MAKQTLKEKIERVGFCIFTGFAWYLIISFFLLSDYPIYDSSFDHKKAYEVIKDGLIISAAFLAPVAAFVLFSDWKEPYVEKVIEDDSLKIYEGINNGMNELHRILFEIDNSDNFKEDDDSVPAELINELFEKTDKLKMLNVHLGARSSATKNFTECAADLLEKIRGVSNELSTLCSEQLRICNPHVHNDLSCDDQEFSERRQREYECLYSQVSQTIPELKTLERELKMLCDELKIKA